MPQGVFITGTDTGAGKTRISAAFCASLLEADLDPGYFKPFQTGQDDDCAEVGRTTGLPLSCIARPVYQFALPAAPWRAARAEGRTVQLAPVIQAWRDLPPRRWVVEGAGGLLVPLNERETVADLIRALELPAIVVASTRLGTINHTLLTLEAASSRGIPVLGVVLNGEPDPGLREVIETHGQTRVLAEVPWSSDLPRLPRELLLELWPGVLA